MQQCSGLACWAYLNKYSTNYLSYNHALEVLKLKTLSERRDVLCMKFARKAIKSEKYSTWFVPDSNTQILEGRLIKPKKHLLEPQDFKNQPYHT